MEYLKHCDKIRQVPDIHYTFNKGGSEADKLLYEDGKPTKRALTAIPGYFDILELAKEYDDKEMTKTIENTIIELEMKLLDRMLDSVNYKEYKDSDFRNYVKRSLKFGYRPHSEKELYLYNKLKRYVVAGTTKRH